MGSNCRGCGRKLIWIKTPEGKAIPLDASAPVWQVYDDHPPIRMLTCYVSHFSVCPKANEFSKSKKEK